MANRLRTIKKLLKIKDVRQVTLFLIVLSIILISFIIYLSLANSALSKSQSSIKNCYSEHLQKVDSLYVHLMAYNKELTCDLMECNSKVLADSIILHTLNNGHTLTNSQYQNLTKVVSTHLDKIYSYHKEYDSKIQKDSVLLSVEKNLLEGQTKNMINLHLDKISHEYSNITVWAAVLTVLFLVFSFYSIFKMDEFIQQGTEGVKEIRQLRREGHDVLKSIRDDSEKLKSNTNQTIDEFMSQQQLRLSEFNQTLEGASSQISVMIEEQKSNIVLAKENFDRQSLPIIQDFEKRMNTLLTQNENMLSEKLIEFNNLVEQTNKLIEFLASQQRRKSKRGRANG